MDNVDSGYFVVNLPDPQGKPRNYLYIPNNINSGDQGEKNSTALPSTDQDEIDKTRAADVPNSTTPDKISSGGIYEIQHLQNSSSNNNKKSFGSYFVDSTVVSDGSLYISSRVDPLFFILSSHTSITTQDNNSKWMPLDQVLAAYPIPIQNALSTDQLKNLMDFKQLGDEDYLICRYNEAKACEWLKSKYLQCVSGIRTKLMRHPHRCDNASNNKQGAFAPGFNMEAVTNTDSADDGSNKEDVEELNATAKRYALQLLCEYLNDNARKLLFLAMGFPSDYTLEQEKTTAVSVTFSNTVVTPDPAEMSENKRKLIEPAKTFGQKKLAKVDTKGMKSLTSFFTSSKQKK